MLLICYDGSPDAREAIARCGELEKGAQAVVLTVWEPFVEVLARTGVGMAGGVMFDLEEIDAEAQRTAHNRADDGAELARRGGLEATARVAKKRSTVAATILAEAEDCGAAQIVVGTRGLGGFKSALLGSVSRALLQQSDRPITVVPSQALAHERSEHLHHLLGEEPAAAGGH